MRILKEFKLPDFKMPKFKMSGINNIEELKINFEKSKESKEIKKNSVKRYSTIQEMFIDVTEKYKDNICILEKFDHKGEFKEIKYSEFKEEVIALG
ncbi:MAG: hypothetical protein RR957_03105, partial [Oscillospiraceae bacterium]